MLTGLLSLLVAAAFSGAAIYVSFVEQPARLTLDDRALLAEWQPSYKRGTMMQASIAIIACLLGLLAWWQTGGAMFLAGAVFAILPWPWTLLFMMPTNHALEAMTPETAGSGTRDLIVKWGRLHLMRVALGVLAALAFLWGCASL